MTPSRRTADESRSRHLQYRRDCHWRLFLFRWHGGVAALPRRADPSACDDQRRQSRSWPRRARSTATHWKPARLPETHRYMGAHPIGQRDDRAAHCARRAPQRTGCMSVLQALDIGLSALVLAVAVWTIAAREAFAAVAGYVAYGLLLSIVWVRLFAVDVALTEAAIGGGVTGVLLIGAAARLREAECRRRRTTQRAAASCGGRSLRYCHGGPCGRRAAHA